MLKEELVRNNDNAFQMEEAIQLMKEGDMSSYEDVFNCFTPLVHYFSKKYKIKDFDADDIFQEARIILLHCIKEYDGRRGLNFPGFYKLMLRNRIYSLIRREQALKRKNEYNDISYSQTPDDQLLDFCVDEARQIEYEGLEDIIHVREVSSGYFETLSAFEQEVFRYFIKGDSYEAIAAKTAKSPKQVKHAYDRCLQKLKVILW